MLTAQVYPGRKTVRVRAPKRPNPPVEKIDTGGLDYRADLTFSIGGRCQCSAVYALMTLLSRSENLPRQSTRSRDFVLIRS